MINQNPNSTYLREARKRNGTEVFKVMLTGLWTHYSLQYCFNILQIHYKCYFVLLCAYSLFFKNEWGSIVYSAQK